MEVRQEQKVVPSHREEDQTVPLPFPVSLAWFEPQQALPHPRIGIIRTGGTPIVAAVEGEKEIVKSTERL